MAHNAPPEPAPRDVESPRAPAPRTPESPEHPESGERRTYSAEEVSQGYTVLRTPTRRIIFFGGLIAAVIFAIIVGFLR